MEQKMVQGTAGGGMSWKEKKTLLYKVTQNINDTIGKMKIIKAEEIHKSIKRRLLSGAKTPHNTSYPVIYRENDKYYLAVFIFFYKREDIKAGAVDRPTVWAIADIVTGDIIEERQARENDFSDARYDVKYNIRSETKHDTSKQYYTDAFAILDAVRSNLICTGTLCEQGYRMYLDKIVANVPEEYKRFYKDLSV